MQTPEALRTWGGVCALALAAFIFNTTEFVPVGLLSEIAADFAMPVHDVGLVLTIYAWVVALASLPLMLLTRRIERRRLLGLTLGVFIASHLLCGIAGSFPVLVAGRIGIAFAHAVFWSITATLAVRISPPGKQAQGLGLLATGTSLAMVLGIPLGRVVGQWLGWRATFVLIAVLSCLVLIVLRRLLPPLPSERAGSLAALPRLLRRPMLAALYALTLIVVSGQFVAYSYIEPFAHQVARLSASGTTALLLVFGGTGILGSLLFSRRYDRHPNRFLLGSVAGLSGCMLLLAPAAGAGPLLLGLQAAAWGAAMIAFNLGMQAQTLSHAHDASDLAMSLFSSVYNVGIGTGALLGGEVTEHIGLERIGLYGGALAGGGLLLHAGVVRRLRPRAA